MANRFPLIVNSSVSQIQEIASGDFLDLSESGISNCGNITVLNVTTSGLVSATGNVTGSYIIGNGSLLTGLPAGYANSDVATYLSSGTVSTDIKTTAAISATGAVTGGSLVGTIATGTQNSITSATSLAAVGTIATGVWQGTEIGAAYVATLNQNTTGYAATVSSAAQGNITSVGTLTSLAVTGNISAGNVSATLFTGALSGTATSATTADSAATLTTARAINGVNFDGSAAITVEPQVDDDNATNATRYITFVDNSTAGFKRLNEDSTLNYNPSSGTLSATIFSGVATTARYADLAENYLADSSYNAGTVVEFGGNAEVTISSTSHSTAVAGIVSTSPAYLMNSHLEGEHVVAVALTGRVPCVVQGPVKKGTVLVSGTIPGTAMAIDNLIFQPGCVVGKAMESIDSVDVKTIEVAVGRL